MLYVSKNATPKFAKFSTTQSAIISRHTTVDGITKFIYLFFIDIDKSKIASLDGNLQLSAFASQKSKSPITVKRSDVASVNFFKKIDRQRLEQVSSRQYGKRYFSTKFIDRPDLNSSTVKIEIEIPSANVSSTFLIDIVNIKEDGSSSTIDTLEVDHSLALQQYDIPSVDFLLTTTRSNYGKIYAAASTTDSNVGSFKFFLKKNANSGFEQTRFDNQVQSRLKYGNIADVEFDVQDCDQSYTVLARPVSLILEQEVGNFRSETLGFKQEVKQIPFYISSISNSSVYFTAQGLDDSVSKIFLYRQRRNMLEREFVNYFSRSGSTLVAYDKSRNPQYDYFYTVDYTDDQGITHTSSTTLIVPALKLDSLAKIYAKLSSDKQNIVPGYLTFETEVQYDTSTTYDKIVEDVKSLGLESLFSSDLEKMTNNIKPLIRVLVTKISTSTGEETEIGVFSPGTIKIKNGLLNNIQIEKNIYRFEVAVRSIPETLETLASSQNLISNNAYNLKSIADLSSKLIGNRIKSGQNNFSTKFLSRSSIRNSELRYGDAANLADLGFYSGRTGIFSDVTVTSGNSGKALIKNLKFSTRPKGSYITWTSSLTPSNIDFFEINVDGLVLYSHPTSGTVQTFHLGNILPSNITVTAISRGARLESSTTTLKVNNGN